MSHVTLAYQSDRDGFELTIKDDEVKGLRTKLEELARVSQKALRYDNETMAADSETVIALRQQLIAKDDEVKGLNAYEYVVRRIAEWDQLNPPISGDHAWVKKLVEDVLLDNEGEAKRTGEWFGTVQRELAAEKARADKAEAMLQAIDMMDLAPLATRPDLSLWQRENPWPPADYACEPSHKHPTVSDYLADLARRTGGEA